MPIAQQDTRKRRGVRYGSQVPSRKVYLHRKRDYTLGPEAIALYERTGRKAQPWQVDLIGAILAVDRDGIYIHSKFGYSVPRRNGKNEVITIRELYGLTIGERIMHTAHRTATSTAAYERLVELLIYAGYVEGDDFSLSRSPGREKITFFRDGSRDGVIVFRTRTTKGGLGEGYDLLVIDEAQEYTEDQESSVKYVVSDSHNPQTVMLGTPPTAVSSGTVFVKMRNETLAGDRKNTGWAEWSVDKLSDVHNVELWYLANPAMGYQLNERKVEDEITTDDVDFNIQRLGLWIEYNQHSAITEDEWDKLKVDDTPDFSGKLHVGVKFGHDGANVAMSVAVATTDGRIFIESIDCKGLRGGTDWIMTYLKQMDMGGIWIDGANGQNILAERIVREKIKPAPTLPTVKEIISAGALFEQILMNKTLCHAGQPSLKASATNCDKRPIGTNGGFGYRSIRDDVDVALLESAILAVYSCYQAMVHKPKSRIR